MEAARVVHYTAQCRNCNRFTRNFLRAMITAETKSTVHALRHHHTVDITATDVQTLTSTPHLTVPSASQMTLLYDSETEIPF